LLSLGSSEDDFSVLRLKYHLRYSLEYLRQLRLIDTDGRAIDLAGIVCHIFYLEPYNFGFLYLLQTGCINRIQTYATRKMP